MYLRAFGSRFTQMNAYFLVMNSKRCKLGEKISPNRKKSLRHVVMVAKVLDDNKPKIYLKSEFVLFHSSILFNSISVIWQMLAKCSGLNPKEKENNCVVFTNSIKWAREIRKHKKARCT